MPYIQFIPYYATVNIPLSYYKLDYLLFNEFEIEIISLIRKNEVIKIKK
jgi:hypothetical protein